MKLADGIKFSVCALRGHRTYLSVEPTHAGVDAWIERCRRCAYADVLAYRWPDDSDHRRASSWTGCG